VKWPLPSNSHSGGLVAKIENIFEKIPTFEMNKKSKKSTFKPTHMNHLGGDYQCVDYVVME
jgi:hypothetical protein